MIGKYLPAKKRAVLVAHHHHRVGLMGDERNREGKGTSVCQQYILYSLFCDLGLIEKQLGDAFTKSRLLVLPNLETVCPYIAQYMD